MKASIELNNRYMKNKRRILTGSLVLFLSIFFICLTSATAFAAAPQYEWTKTMGGTGASGNAYSVAVDGSGNIYTTGSFSGTLDFDPGPGVDNHISVGSSDIFLTRVNADGTYGWTKTMGGTGTAAGISVALDGSEIIYISGGFSATVDFDPGAGVDNHISVGSSDMFLTRINADGTYGWTKTMGGTGNDFSPSVKVDISRNTYITGQFQNTVDFDPGPGVDNHTSVGSSDIFLTRINADGTYGWTKTMGGIGWVSASSMALDSSVNIFITGAFASTVDFDPGPGVDNHASIGAGDIFFTRINADGSYGWTKTMGGAGTDIGLSAAVDASGNVYIMGEFQGTVDFNPGVDIDNHIYTGPTEGTFLTRINADGSYGWTKTGGDINGNIYARDITVDLTGNVYLSGIFLGTADFDFEVGVDSHTATASDIFITRLNADSSYAWTKTMGGTGFDYGDGVAVDASSNVYVSGRFEGTVDFDPGIGVDNHTSPGTTSIFLTKFSQNRDELLVNFSASGLWAKNNNAGWTKLHALSPTLIATGDLDGSGIDEALAVFSPYGIYARYDNAGPWTRLHSLVPDIIATGDMDGGGLDETIAVFSAYGVYARYNDAGDWTRLTSLVPEQVVMADLDGSGQSDLVCDFGAMGIWAKYNNGAWTKIIGANPALMAAGDLDGGGMEELIAYFPAFGGIWTKMNNAGWTKLHALAPESIVTADLDGTGKDEVIVDFGVYGIWAKYDNTIWTKIHSVSPDAMTTGDLDGSGRYDLVADFGIYGIYVKYNDGAWTRIHTGNPELMSTGNLDGN